MEREVKVDDIFEVDGVKIQAQIADSVCWGCYFSTGHHCIISPYDDIVGDCSNNGIDL